MRVLLANQNRGNILSLNSSLEGLFLGKREERRDLILTSCKENQDVIPVAFTQLKGLVVILPLLLTWLRVWLFPQLVKWEEK